MPKFDDAEFLLPIPIIEEKLSSESTHSPPWRGGSVAVPNVTRKTQAFLGKRNAVNVSRVHLVPTHMRAARSARIDKYCYVQRAHASFLTVVDTKVIALGDAHLLQRLAVHQDVQSLRRITMRRP